MRTALDLFTADPAVATPDARRARARLRDGTVIRLPLERWLGPVTAVDEQLLAGARGPVIDLGCGPGRHLHALARRGVFALGVDIAPAAVALARGRGGTAIEASIFDELPGAGRWRTALLLDGNIGIGGRPRELLERVRWLLAADGELLVEFEHPRVSSATVEARIEIGAETSPWFRWARVGARDVAALAAAAGFAVARSWRSDERWFARLVVDAGA